ncbi:MAG: hypothetical protein JWO15_1360 [Sphingomonadales bacterium]|nr:hypothetical protein [Sphingomonadales bacterium]
MNIRSKLPMILFALGACLASGTSMKAYGQARQNAEAQVLPQAMRDLLDREAIRDLPIIYCHNVWEKNIDGIVSQFTSDGELVLPANLGSGAKGTKALREFYIKSIASADPRPFVHNHYVVLLGGGRAKGFVYAELRYGSQKFRTAMIGVYADDYLKVGGVWKLARREFTATPVPN